MFVGEGIAVPTEREIDDTYLDANEEDLKKEFAKFKLDWSIYGVTIMCEKAEGKEKDEICPRTTG